MGVEISKRYSYSYDYFLRIPCDSPHKTCYGHFEISKFEIFLKRLKFSLIWDPMGVKISKRYFSYSFGSFSTKIFRPKFF